MVLPLDEGAIEAWQIGASAKPVKSQNAAIGRRACALVANWLVLMPSTGDVRTFWLRGTTG